MTITLQLWMVIPALLVMGAVVMFWLGSKETGMLGGLLQGLIGFGMLLVAGAFLLGRWLA